MAVASGQASIPTTAGGTLLVPAANTAWPGSRDEDGPSRCVVISNPAGATCYLGASGLTSGTGFLLLASSSVTLWLYPDETVYGLSASGTLTVSYLESGS